MSLLNDMLRDLSQAHKTQDDVACNSETGMEHLLQSGMLKPEPRPFLPSVIVFISVLLIFFAWKYYNSPEFNNAIKENPAIADTHQQTSSPVGNPMSSEVEVASTREVLPEEQVHDQAADLQEQMISGNASETFNIRAEQSTEVLTERLASLEKAIDTLSIVMQQKKGADHQSDESRADDIAKVDDDFSAENLMGESVSVEDPFAQGIQPAAQQVSVDVAQTHMDDTFPEDAHLAITPNATFMDQRRADLARNLHRQGESEQAVSQLRSFIATEKSPRESTLALLDIFYDQGHVLELNKTLSNAVYLTDVDRQFYAAKIAVIEQRESDAVALLEAYLADAENHEHYRAFLAGLYQRTGKYAEAGTAYRRLLSNFGEKPAYWLGFALAQDSLNQVQTARQAYLRLANYSGLQPEVQSYIQQRLASLQ